MTPRSPARILEGHCDRSFVTAASRAAAGNVRFGNPLYPAAQVRTGAPRRQGLHIGTWVAGARLLPPDLAFPTVDPAALRRRIKPNHRAPGGAS